MCHTKRSKVWSAHIGSLSHTLGWHAGHPLGSGDIPNDRGASGDNGIAADPEIGDNDGARADKGPITTLHAAAKRRGRPQMTISPHDAIVVDLCARIYHYPLPESCSCHYVRAGRDKASCAQLCTGRYDSRGVNDGA